MKPTLETVVEEVTPEASSPTNHQGSHVPMGEETISLSRSDESLNRWFIRELGQLERPTLPRPDESFDRWLNSELDRLEGSETLPSWSQNNASSSEGSFSVRENEVSYST